MIIRKLVKSTSNNVGYITIPKMYIGKNIEVIIRKKVIKEKKTKSAIIYLKNEYIGETCYININ